MSNSYLYECLHCGRKRLSESFITECPDCKNNSLFLSLKAADYQELLQSVSAMKEAIKLLQDQSKVLLLLIRDLQRDSLRY